jgi:hypothetical protein
MHSALDEAVALQTPQRLRQHFLRDPTDLALKRGVTHRATSENLDRKRGPFVSNAVKHQPRWTAWIEYRRSGRAFWHGFCLKQFGGRCKLDGNIPNGAYGSWPHVVDCWFSMSEIKS